ncbi:gliding motility lipoprotein GldH [Bacteroides sp. 224]|uniref:gliding motility lipoprotein GldH n=1 Tax=Bacteroides sp. 224 TaxID=2302936 RepID=UPI0013D73C12|nr:gliding motility lipoprotein GldH [Bacteroides sp. 224]NDV66802.1 gliding motility lipoprotein GldH [Bacteroides sp. 224]
MRAFKVTILFLALLCTLGCTDKTVVYHSYHHIPSYEWNKNDTLLFNIAIPDSLCSYRIYLLVRTLNSYAYKNLTLNIEYPIGDTITHKKDIPFQVSPEYNDEYTAKWGGLYQAIEPVYDKYVEKPDTLRFRVNHQMKDDVLKGISDIGILIER